MRVADEKLIINEFGPQYECDTLIDLPREREGKKGSLKTECKIAHKSPSAKLCRGWFMSDQLVLCFISRCRQPSPWWTPVHRESTLTSHQNGRNSRYDTMYREERWVRGERGKERLLFFHPLVSSPPLRSDYV